MFTVLNRGTVLWLGYFELPLSIAWFGLLISMLFIDFSPEITDILMRTWSGVTMFYLMAQLSGEFKAGTDISSNLLKCVNYKNKGLYIEVDKDELSVMCNYRNIIMVMDMIFILAIYYNACQGEFSWNLIVSAYLCDLVVRSLSVVRVVHRLKKKGCRFY